MFVEMKQKDIKILKEKLWLQNDKKCPLLDVEVPLEKMALDHIHKLKSEPYSEQKGSIRNSLEFRSNAIEGKITNNWKRYFGADESKHPISLPDFLRNLADYLEEGAYKCEDDKYYIHPTELPKEKKLGKRAFNKIAKLYKEEFPKRKELEFPKSSKPTKQIKELALKYEVNIG